MPFLAVGAEERQVSTAADGSLSPALPAGTLSTDIVLAIGVRDTQQPNSGYFMNWSISSGWTLLTEVVAASPGFTTTGRVHLAVWVARGEPAPTISWTGTAQSDNSRIGDIAVCATYRPGGDLVDDLANTDDNAAGSTTAPWSFTASDTGYVVGVHAFRPNNSTITAADAEGFTENERFEGPTNFRPVLVLTERQTPSVTTYDAPTWDSSLLAAQMVIGGFPIVPALGSGIYVDGAVH